MDTKIQEGRNLKTDDTLTIIVEVYNRKKAIREGNFVKNRANCNIF